MGVKFPVKKRYVKLEWPLIGNTVSGDCVAAGCNDQ